MVKKVKKIDTSSSIEMPMAQIDDVDDVAEDYEVFDMSNIAAPIIEFELPNLVAKNEPKTSEKAENDQKSMKKPKKSVKKTPEAPKSDSEGSDARKSENAQKSAGKEAEKAPETGKIQLTAEKLNNELVGLRQTVLKAKNQWISKVCRKKKELEKKKKEGKEEAVDAQLKRKMEEILALKTIDRDTIAKFAVLNTKTLNELKINGSTPIAEQVMYKLACHEVVVSRIQEIKQKYNEWNKTAAFFMQRLGKQYSTKPEKKEKKAKNSDEKMAKKDSEDVVDSGEESDVEEDALEDSEGIVGDSEDVEKEEEEGDDAPEDYDQSDVEMVDSDDEDVGVEAAKKRRNVLLNLIGVKEDASRPVLNPKKRKIVDDDSEDVTETPEPSKKQKTKEAMKAVLEKALKAEKGEKPKKVVPKKAKTSSEKDSEDVEEEDQQTLVMKIDLSQGGKIAKSTKAPAPKKASTTPEDVKEDSEDESAGFFLPKGTSSARKAKSGGIAKRMEKLGVEEDQKKSDKKNDKKKGNRPVGKKNFQPSTQDKKKGTSKNPTTSEGPMHPSWIASQAKKKELAAAKPAGKRILFNDED
ncbi:hypothetical protein B9Z55_000155 [Caenorhabditis nigoni]|uniref:Serum response factor-binding protein 1 n=1 Tax=Caenorhabditis nigoni TaxID=1611254 RepID=A0A2G5VGJ5_9PELO|nr:hypothetical protein B9Z55_000155 [Caenorhabditis nigoni]